MIGSIGISPRVLSISFLACSNSSSLNCVLGHCLILMPCYASRGEVLRLHFNGDFGVAAAGEGAGISSHGAFRSGNRGGNARMNQGNTPGLPAADADGNAAIPTGGGNAR